MRVMSAMRSAAVAAAVLAAWGTSGLAQESGSTGDAQSDAALQASQAPSETPALPEYLLTRDTPVRLMVLTEVSTRNVQPGTRFKLRLHEPVTDGEVLLLPVGAAAFGVVTSAEKSGAGLNNRGALTAKLTHLEIAGCSIPLEGDASAEGSKSGNTAAVFLAAGPVALFARGNNARLKAGELTVAFTAADVRFRAVAGKVIPVSVTASEGTPAPCPGQ